MAGLAESDVDVEIRVVEGRSHRGCLSSSAARGQPLGVAACLISDIRLGGRMGPAAYGSPAGRTGQCIA